ncbi:MAG TPA: DciA family protein, partial [Clostridia bacterium]|nr:DciA family protein [Clostridia bacterium]
MADAIRRLPAEEAAGTAWTFVCGQAVSDRTKVLEFREGILRIEVPDAAWRAQLLGMAGHYRAALTEYSGQTVQRIEFLLPEEAIRWAARRDNP